MSNILVGYTDQQINSKLELSQINIIKNNFLDIDNEINITYDGEPDRDYQITNRFFVDDNKDCVGI